MLEKIKKNCYIDESTGCWIWKRSVLSDWDANRRPTSRDETGRHRATPRIAWEYFYGEKFPEDLYAGHLCEGSSPCSAHCVNPEHITPVTAAENEQMKTIYSDADNLDEYRKSQGRHSKRRGLPTIRADWSQTQKVEHILKYEVEKQTCDIMETPCLVPKNFKNKGNYWRRHWVKDGVRKNYTIHRLVAAEKLLELDYFDIPSSLVIRHMCHNKSCCNPEHLKTGTHSDNTKDSRDYHSNTDLTLENVIDMLKEWKVYPSGVKKTFWEQKVLPKHNITYSSCTQILAGARWPDAYAFVFGEKKKSFLREENLLPLLEDAISKGLWVHGKKGDLKKQWAQQLNVSVSTIGTWLKSLQKARGKNTT